GFGRGRLSREGAQGLGIVVDGGEAHSKFLLDGGALGVIGEGVERYQLTKLAPIFLLLLARLRRCRLGTGSARVGNSAADGFGSALTLRHIVEVGIVVATGKAKGGSRRQAIYCARSLLGGD